MKLNVIKKRVLWWQISAAIILAGIISMVISTATIGTPLRLGLDFVGGTRLQFELDCTKPANCDKPIDVATVRDVMEEQGLGNSSIQVLGEKQQALTIRTKTLNGEE